MADTFVLSLRHSHQIVIFLKKLNEEKHRKYRFMKSTIASFVLFTLLFVSNAFGQEVEWIKLDEAQTLNQKKKTSKLIFVDMYTAWCGPCRMMERNTFADPKVAEVLNQYHTVKFNAEGNDVLEFNGKEYSNPNYNPAKANTRNAMHQLTAHLKVTAYPTMLIIDEKGEVIQRIIGYHKPEQLKPMLERVLNAQASR